MIVRLMLVAGCLLTFASAHAQDSPLISTGQLELNQGGAELILKHSQAQARQMELKVNIAVVDRGGHLMAFIRMDGARAGSGITAQTKATAAATFRTATGPIVRGDDPNLLLNLSLQSAAAAGGAKYTSLFGGVPIEVDGQIIGAVGVGGATGEQDAEIARAGIAALVEAFKGKTQSDN